ncbi:MAG: hypothetical protein AAGB14_13470 [Verrucomicrobiota bacterium]
MALGFLAAALLTFVIFHLAPAVYERSFTDGDAPWVAVRGYTIWQNVVEVLRSPGDAGWDDFMISAALLMGPCVVLAPPFMVRVFSRSRILWWTVVISSSLMMCGLSGIVGWFLLHDYEPSEHQRLGPGIVSMLIFPVFNFIGLLCVRRRVEGPAAANEAG